MPVTMSGSPTATAYPQVGYGSAADNYKQKRADEEKAKKAKLKNDFEELRKKKLRQAEKEAKERKEKRAKEEKAYKERMSKMREKSIAERQEEQKQRAAALQKVDEEHAVWLAEQQAREHLEHSRTTLHSHGEIDNFPIAPDRFAELEVDDTLAHAFEASTDGLYRQRAQDEANEMERQAREKQDRERKVRACACGMCASFCVQACALSVYGRQTGAVLRHVRQRGHCGRRHCPRHDSAAPLIPLPAPPIPTQPAHLHLLSRCSSARAPHPSFPCALGFGLWRALLAWCPRPRPASLSCLSLSPASLSLLSLSSLSPRHRRSSGGRSC